MRKIFKFIGQRRKSRSIEKRNDSVQKEAVVWKHVKQPLVYFWDYAPICSLSSLPFA